MKNVVTSVAALTLVAVAGAAQAASLNGIMVMDMHAKGALTMSGSSKVEVPTVYVNSDSAEAVTGSGSASLAAAHLHMCGSAKFSGSAGCTGVMNKAAAPYADPMGGMSIPASAGMADLGKVSQSGGSKTISPGYYSQGISISGNGTVTMQPGVYVVAGGVSISTSNLVGEGVTIVIQSGGMSLSGGSTVKLTPMSSGAMAGVVIAQPSSNTSDMTLSGGSGVTVAGTIYAPGAMVTLSGNGSMASEGPSLGDAVVASRVVLSGSGTIKVGHAGPSPAVPLPTMVFFD